MKEEDLKAIDAGKLKARLDAGINLFNIARLMVMSQREVVEAIDYYQLYYDKERGIYEDWLSRKLRDGFSPEEIAKKYKVPISKIRPLVAKVAAKSLQIKARSGGAERKRIDLDEATVRSMIESGMSRNKIAAALGYSEFALNSYIERRGLEYKSLYKKFGPISEEVLRELASQDLSIEEIVRRTKSSRYNVKKYLKLYGIEYHSPYRT